MHLSHSSLGVLVGCCERFRDGILSVEKEVLVFSNAFNNFSWLSAYLFLMKKHCNSMQRRFQLQVVLLSLVIVGYGSNT